jgi:nucleotide-binding universal stress UspA family protein
VDGSDEATAAVRWAARRAVATGGGLSLLHAYSMPVAAPAAAFGTVASPRVYDLYAQAGQAVLEAAAAAARAESATIEVTTELVLGGAAQALIGASAGADLVVVGSRGHGGFAGLLLGSVGVQVSAHAACPTAVVRGHDRPAGGGIVVGVDGSDPANAALRFAFAEAARRGVAVMAVHAWSIPQPTGVGEAFAAAWAEEHDLVPYEEAARRLLADALAPWRAAYPQVEVSARLAPAGPSEALVAAGEGASMVVVGSRGHGGFAGLLLGSTSQSVLHHAPCPVVVTRADPVAAH